MKKTFIIALCACVILTAVTAGVFAKIGWDQAMNNRDFTDWTVWIDDDYNVCIFLNDGSLYMVPWCMLAATPEAICDEGW